MIKCTGSESDQPDMLVIFDCDGVLVDTEWINRHALISVLRDIGIGVTEEEAAEHLHGLSNQGIVGKVKALWGIQLADHFILDLESAELELVRRCVQPIEGVRDAALEIANLGSATCVASNGTLAAMRERLTYAGLIDLFDGRLFSAEQVALGKPSPDLFLHAAASMGHGPSSCIVVEDSVVGVTAGRAAGMRVFAFAARSRLELAPTLEEAGGMVFSEMSMLPQLLLQESLGN